MTLSHRQERACVLVAIYLATFIAYRTVEWRNWTREVKHEDAYLAGPRDKSEMEFVRSFYAPKKKAVAHHHHRRRPRP